MLQLPFYIPALFIVTTIVTLYLLSRATIHSKGFLIIVSLWLLLQGIVSVTGFYADENSVPPRFLLLVIPPFVSIAITFSLRPGQTFIDKLDAGSLLLMNIVRIPVELTLYALFTEKKIPEIMTFEGRNLDILSGITTVIMYMLQRKNKLHPLVFLIWNIGCLALLANIVTMAILAAPFRFQQLAFDQPNVGVLYFPFTWLPAFIVPAVLWSHLVLLRKLYTERRQFRRSVLPIS